MNYRKRQHAEGEDSAPQDLADFVASHPPPEGKGNGEVSTANLAFIAFVANIGSFLFGFDFGAICWFLASIEDSTDDGNIYFRIIISNDGWIGLIAAGASIGAFFTYLSLLFFGNSIPKRDEIMIAALLFFIGALCESFSGDMSWSTWYGLSIFLVGRFIYGAGIATSFHSVPIYVSEIGPAELRGMIGSSTESMISTGVVVSYIVGYCYQEPFGWIVTFRIAYIVALVMGLLAMFLPHSPAYMVRHGYDKTEVLQSIQFVKPFADDGDLQQLQLSFDEELKERKRWDVKWRKSPASDGCCSSIFELLPSEVKALVSDGALRRCLSLALILVMLQMFAGQSAVLYFANDIFETICPTNPDDCILGLGIAKLLSAYSMLFIADSFGRREFLVGGLSIMNAGLITLICGIRYDSTYAAVTGIYVAMMGYEVSLGTMLWILLNEIFPRFVRSAANSIAVSSLFLWSVVVTFSLPLLYDSVGLMYVFVIFTCASGISLFLVFLFVPDTRGVDIEVAYKLVKTQCDESLSPIGLGSEEEEEDETEMLDDVSDASDESFMLIHPTHRKSDSEPVMI